jgi:hypothetical protein
LSVIVPFEDDDDLRSVLAGLIAIDMQQIRKHGLPALYRSGVRYRSIHGAARCRSDARESCERFLSARQLLIERFGDCKDLACYRVAELRLLGEKAKTLQVRTPIGWHIKVRRGDGTIEDPSVKLGMKVRRI